MSLILGWLLGKVKGVLNYWPEILVAVVIVLAIYQYNRVVSEKDTIQKSFEAHLKADDDATASRLEDNHQKELQAEKKQAEVSLSHLDELNKLRSYYEDAINGKTGKYDASINLWRERVLAEFTKNLTTEGLPDIQSPSNGSTTESQNSDTATLRQSYRQLEEACAITTADYNALWDSWNESCTTFGCR
jgi:uncharacterized membrane protein YvbJ